MANGFRSTLVTMGGHYGGFLTQGADGGGLTLQVTGGRAAGMSQVRREGVILYSRRAGCVPTWGVFSEK